MLSKINFVSCLTALVCFFIPWMEVQCSGQRMTTQTGVQAIYGDTSAERAALELRERMKEMGAESGTAGSPAMDERLDFSILTAGALVLTGGAATAAFLAFRHGTSTTFSGVLCAVALCLLVMQKHVGFPLEKRVAEMISRNQAAANPGGFPSIQINTPLSLLPSLVTRPAWYVELAALGLPALFLANTLLDRLKRKEVV